jgi:hypothetical protein
LRGIERSKQKKTAIITRITNKDPNVIYGERVKRLARQTVITSHKSTIGKPLDLRTELYTLVNDWARIGHDKARVAPGSA